MSDQDKWDRQKEAMACGYVADKPRHQYTPDFNNKGNPSILYKNCIGNHYYGKWASIINYYNMYEKGIMPFKGGLMDQPAKFVEIMDLVHNLIKENEQEVQRKQQLATRNRASGKRSSKR